MEENEIRVSVFSVLSLFFSKIETKIEVFELNNSVTSVLVLFRFHKTCGSVVFPVLSVDNFRNGLTMRSLCFVYVNFMKMVQLSTCMSLKLYDWFHGYFFHKAPRNYAHAEPNFINEFGMGVKRIFSIEMKCNLFLHLGCRVLPRFTREVPAHPQVTAAAAPTHPGNH